MLPPVIAVAVGSKKGAAITPPITLFQSRHLKYISAPLAPFPNYAIKLPLTAAYDEMLMRFFSDVQKGQYTTGTILCRSKKKSRNIDDSMLRDLVDRSIKKSNPAFVFVGGLFGCVFTRE